MLVGLAGILFLPLPNYRDTLHCLLECFAVFMLEGLVMSHRDLLALLLIYPEAHSGWGGQGGKEEADGGDDI